MIEENDFPKPVEEIMISLSHKDWKEVKYQEVIRRGGIVSWGEDNKYPYYIKSLRHKSTMHSRILDSKGQLMAGGGWKNMPEELFNNADSKNDMNDILYQLMDSFNECGGFFLKVFFNKDSSVGKIECIPFEKVRIVYPEEKKEVINGKEVTVTPTPDDIEYFRICENWDDFRCVKKDYHVYDKTLAKKFPTQIYYCKLGNRWYPEPIWISAKECIELEQRLDVFHLKSVINGFHTSKHISLIGPKKTQEEKDTIVRKIRMSLEGEENTNKTLFTFVENKEMAPIIQDISGSNINNDKYITLQKERVETSIMTAHGATNPNLFSIKTPGQLGGTKELVDSLNIFQAMSIDPIQKIVEDTFEYLYDLTDLKIQKFRIFVPIEINPIEIIKDINLNINQKKALLEAHGVHPDLISGLLTTETNTI